MYFRKCSICFQDWFIVCNNLLTQYWKLYITKFLFQTDINVNTDFVYNYIKDIKIIEKAVKINEETLILCIDYKFCEEWTQ